MMAGQSHWPESTSETKPWTRWWWMGNAVDKEGIRNSLIDLSNAGIGGVEIVPIYGAKGFEDNYIDFLSKEWLEIMEFTVDVAGSTYLMAAVLGVVAVTVAPLLTWRRLSRMDVPATLRIVE